MLYHITKRELIHAQIALFGAVALQVTVWLMNKDLVVGPQLLIIATEIALACVLGFTASAQSKSRIGLQHAVAVMLLALISVANVSSLALVLHQLVVSHVAVTGTELLVSALAIFGTNIIIFALWYWELDSPGLSGKRLSKSEKDFEFTQQDLKNEYPRWQPQFLDFLYLAITNAINFAPADARPLTHAAKMLMGAQAMISIFTLALVIARSVTILGA